METKTQAPENLNLKYLDLHLDQIKNLITSTGTFMDSSKIEYAECVTLLQSIIESKKDRLENVRNNIETDGLVYDVERIHKLRLIELITQL
jgi:2-oxo-4-hydroxy-4-carboxy--5-ureidoimidazoline (OHCU) decarboxylase